ncbi:inositol monophosphatase family protein, partial [Zooshikella harenae]
MDWKLFCHLFASTGDFWQTTAVGRHSEYLTLLDKVDGTTRADKMVSSAMIQGIKALVGEDVVVSSEEDIRDVSTGFVIDPIDGSWNYKYGYSACCRVVSYLENSQVKFFAIYNMADSHCVCSNGTDFFHNSQYYTFNEKDISPLVAVMYN